MNNLQTERNQIRQHEAKAPLLPTSFEETELAAEQRRVKRAQQRCGFICFGVLCATALIPGAAYFYGAAELQEVRYGDMMQAQAGSVSDALFGWMGHGADMPTGGWAAFCVALTDEAIIALVATMYVCGRSSLNAAKNKLHAYCPGLFSENAADLPHDSNAESVVGSLNSDTHLSVRSQ